MCLQDQHFDEDKPKKIINKDNPFNYKDKESNLKVFYSTFTLIIKDLFKENVINHILIEKMPDELNQIFINFSESNNFNENNQKNNKWYHTQLYKITNQIKNKKIKNKIKEISNNPCSFTSWVYIIYWLEIYKQLYTFNINFNNILMCLSGVTTINYENLLNNFGLENLIKKIQLWYRKIKLNANLNLNKVNKIKKINKIDKVNKTIESDDWVII